MNVHASITSRLVVRSMIVMTTRLSSYPGRKNHLRLYLSESRGIQSRVKQYPRKYAEAIDWYFHFDLHCKSSFYHQLSRVFGSLWSIL